MKYIFWLLLLTSLSGQVTDKNFKSKVSDGFVVVKFTANWSENNTNGLLGKVKGYEDAVILEVESEKTRKVCKKLRLRNFPSIVLFHNGSKSEVWKGDMDGNLDITIKDLKAAIDDVLAEDVF
jgi:thioredoxin-like negative regulator of GroEL